MLSERLKKETKQLHVDVETLIIPKIKALSSNQSYADVLKIFYGYFSPIEEKITAFVSINTLPDLEIRRKSNSILNDLETIAGTKESNICNDIPAIDNTAEALGALYVLEGSTLGGQHISKMVNDRVCLPGGKGIEFFTGYAGETQNKWNLFKDSLNSYTKCVETEDEIIKAANETFAKFKSWIEKN